jgi:hypothetical protein
MSASSTADACVPVNKKDIDDLVELANRKEEYMAEVVDTSLPLLACTHGEEQKEVIEQRKTLLSYMKRRSKFARVSLERVYSMYPVDNAWSNVCFGSNINGIYRASLDDPMHYCDSGSFLYLSQVAFLSMTHQSERSEMEEIIKTYFKGKRSSIRDDLPRGKFSSGFSRTTLLTAGEKIGLILSLYMALGTEKGESLYSKVIARVQERYDFQPTAKELIALPKRGDIHFFTDLNLKKNSAGVLVGRPLKRTLHGVKDLVRNMSRHEVSFMLVDKEFDELQTEHLLQTVNNVFGSDTSKKLYPAKPLPGVYMGPKNWSIEDNCNADRLFNKLRKGSPPSPTQNHSSDEEESEDDNESWKHAEKKRKVGAKKEEVYLVKRKIKKHCLVRQKVKGSGTSYAILTDLEGFRDLLMQALCFHSFVHYFEEIPIELRANHEFIDSSVRGFINKFSSTIYRGDDSVDCDTCKIHSHLHLATDIQEYGHPMNWEAGKGERGLKTWAKMASATAQKVGLSVFMCQTAQRVADAALLSMVLSHHQQTKDTKADKNRVPPELSIRKRPHFLLNLVSGTTMNVPIRGDENEIVKSPFNTKVVSFLKSVEGLANVEPIEIWKDANIPIHGGQKRVRACSCYDSFGQFFDWVSVQFDPQNDESCYPAKLLLIYRDRGGVMSGIVHGCAWRNNTEKRLSTPLASRWSLEFYPTSGFPMLRKIRLSEIVEVLYVIEHAGDDPKNMGLNVPDRNRVRGKYYVDVIEPRYIWAGKFLEIS